MDKGLVIEALVVDLIERREIIFINSLYLIDLYLHDYYEHQFETPKVNIMLA